MTELVKQETGIDFTQVKKLDEALDLAKNIRFMLKNMKRQ